MKYFFIISTLEHLLLTNTLFLVLIIDHIILLGRTLQLLMHNNDPALIVCL